MSANVEKAVARRATQGREASMRTIRMFLTAVIAVAVLLLGTTPGSRALAAADKPQLFLVKSAPPTDQKVWESVTHSLGDAPTKGVDVSVTAGTFTGVVGHLSLTKEKDKTVKRGRKMVTIPGAATLEGFDGGETQETGKLATGFELLNSGKNPEGLTSAGKGGCFALISDGRTLGFVALGATKSGDPFLTIYRQKPLVVEMNVPAKDEPPTVVAEEK